MKPQEYVILFIFVYCPILISANWIQREPSWGQMRKLNFRMLNRIICEPGKVCVKGGAELRPRIMSEDTWITSPIKQHHDSLFAQTFESMFKKGIYHNEETSRNSTGFSFSKPEDLKNLINFALGDAGEHLGVIKYIDQIFDFSPKTSHIRNLHRRSGNLDAYAIAADWVASAMSGPLVTYLVQPVFTLAEFQLIEKLKVMIFGDRKLKNPIEEDLARSKKRGRGFSAKKADPSDPEPPVETDDGFGIGSVYPNGFAIQIALQQTIKKYKDHGVVESGNIKPAIFISADADYTWEKQAGSQGIGLSHVYRVKTDAMKKMIPEELKTSIEAAIAAGDTPVLVVATAGTPIFGSFDDIEAIMAIARKYKTWFHVDGTCGLGYIFSNDLKTKLKGIEEADSVSWSPSCLFGLHFETGIFLSSYNKILPLTFGLHDSAYVYNTTSLNKERWNVGDNTLQTCRRPFTFAIWFWLKAHGTDNLGLHLTDINSKVKVAVDDLKLRPNFKLLLDNFELPFISFYYKSPQLPVVASSEPGYDNYITAANTQMRQLKEKLLLGNILQLSLSPGKLAGVPDFFTLKLSNSALTKEYIKYIFDQIELCGKNLFEEKKDICDSLPIPANPPSFSKFVSAPIQSIHGDFLKKVSDKIMEKGIYFQDKRTDAPLSFVTPEKLQTIINFTIGPQGLHDNPNELLHILEQSIEYSPHQSHPYWIYQLLSGLDPYSLMADFVLGVLQSSQVDYEDNPVFTLIEDETRKTIIKVLGWPDDSDVIYPPGGSFGNLFASELARHKKYPHFKTTGYANHTKILRGYVSYECHYSLIKGGIYLGIGKNNIVKIKTDPQGRMDMAVLRKQIEDDIAAGMEPLMVGATAGTTVLGSIDPLEAIAALAVEFKLWFHVDGAFGGPLIFAKNPEIKNRLKGLEKADSFSFNPAKLFASTLIMNCFVTRHKGLLQSAHEYINPNSIEPTYYKKEGLHSSEMYLQMERRARAFKFWFMIKGKGLDGLSKHLDYINENVKFCVAEMKKIASFEPFLDAFDVTNVLFMYIPIRLMGMNRTSEEFLEEMGKVAYDLQGKLVEDGIVVVVAQRHTSTVPMHLKFILMSSGITKSDITYLIQEVDRYGRDL